MIVAAKSLAIGAFYPLKTPSLGLAFGPRALVVVAAFSISHPFIMRKLFLLVWLVLGATIGAALAQTRPVTGLVKGPDGEGLPGVTVLLKGTTNGTATAIDGKYSLNVPTASTSATLRFSFVGYVSQEVAVGSKTAINVTLASDVQSLNDVVVIGYQAVQRRDVTGSVSSVSAQQIKDVPVNSAAEALSGRLAGVQVTSAEGTPGNNNVQIRIRGGGSVTQDYM
jgi:hypothetical protein